MRYMKSVNLICVCSDTVNLIFVRSNMIKNFLRYFRNESASFAYSRNTAKYQKLVDDLDHPKREQ